MGIYLRLMCLAKKDVLMFSISNTYQKEQELIFFKKLSTSCFFGKGYVFE